MTQNNKQLALSTLKEYWGYDGFRSIQEDVIQSVLEGNDTVAIASTGTGKALHKDTIVQTPWGVTMMKYLKVGDTVIGRDLKHTKVTAKFQPMTPDHYEFIFDCGTTVKCCGDHLWLVNYSGKEGVVDSKSIYWSLVSGIKFTITGCPIASDREYHTIVSVKPIKDNPEDYYCITVDNKDKLYLITDKFIPTHNTVLYQIPALILDGVTLVISPLKALQKDQIDALESKGIQAALLNSDVGIRAKKKLVQDLTDKKIKILYVAPETLFSPSFTPLIPLLDVKLIAIDESHCCFKEDMLVHTEQQKLSFLQLYDLYKKKEILPQVLCINDSTKKVEYKQITKVYRNMTTSKLICLTLSNSEPIICTPDHKILTLGGYTPASQLSTGSTLITYDTLLNYKTTNAITRIETIKTNVNFVYDIEVKDNHNYFVSSKNSKPILVHNCSQWSDFRPKYQQIHQVNKIFPNAIKLAVTATADDLVIKDIVKNTGIKPNYKLFKGTVDRSNIQINIFKQTKAPSRHVIDVIESFGKEEQGIIYCASREKTKQLSDYLNALGYKAVFYHAALSKKLKDEAQIGFTDKSIKIMCATIAFGMGIDIPDIRYVIHTDAPDSFESYQQQIGRVSRIGNPSYAYMFYDPSSYALAMWLNRKTTKDPSRLMMKNKKLKAFHDFCKINTCRRKALLKVFGEEYTKDNCESCDICLKRKEF